MSSAEARRAPFAPPRAARTVPAGLALSLLGVALLAAIAAFMTVGARGSWSFVLQLRGLKVLQMLLVAYAIGVSTVLFQTITNNRILTPSIMGFDALYVLIQTALVFGLGSAALSAIDARATFALELAAMTGFSLLLFRWLFAGGLRSLHLTLVVGIVFGTFFRSLSGFMQRLIDPNEFVVLQDRFFASFNTVNRDLLLAAAGLTLLVSVFGWRMRRRFDVLALGREAAVGLGLDHRRDVTAILVLVAVLVSVSTALVGPVTFFGLLVANLAYQIVPTHRHAAVLPAAAMLAGLCLVGGQLVLERVFAFDTALAVIVEFVGGVVFILLLLKGRGAR
ncbi:iron chelate uptake ABC transporter family permease subunit [Antarcticirhabdus aurantiaca]|uniref:Iron chelate uptake ABC transporter family permease subunit n=1 Tax=Antarcticirhabdus aurantiaca TaxID=2606717 RepID=A0ACD4NNK7_9HYPH|nr:iron chelate uptake ABC transporter family permease subunit [Antarcticirhabdus aurantiaca]WAJ28470.1 iron chelate uptake ABC transporter family permease subunit [Jeongeuplla avenae]